MHCTAVVSFLAAPISPQQSCKVMSSRRSSCTLLHPPQGRAPQFPGHATAAILSCDAAIRDPDEAWQRHIEDSLALLPAIDKYLNTSSSSTSVSSNSSSSRRVRTRRKAAAAADAVANDADEQQQQQQHHELTVIDVGTGAGLPGMVFAVVRPHWKVCTINRCIDTFRGIKMLSAFMNLIVARTYMLLITVSAPTCEAQQQHSMIWNDEQRSFTT